MISFLKWIAVGLWAFFGIGFEMGWEVYMQSVSLGCSIISTVDSPNNGHLGT